MNISNQTIADNLKKYFQLKVEVEELEKELKQSLKDQEAEDALENSGFLKALEEGLEEL